MRLDEFGVIEKYFLPLTRGRSEAAGLSDDAATLAVPDGQQLVISSDMLHAGVHFFTDQAPEDIARKALRCNISDILAMGAKPYCYQLCLGLPKDLPEDFLPRFTGALAEDQERYNLFLSGGDTTSVLGGLSISVTVFGFVDVGAAKARSGACAGDHIFVTGTIGDAYCGLQMLRSEITVAHHAKNCIQSYYAPDLPFALLPAVQKYARAVLDISDGLIADLSHMARASGLGCDVQVAAIPLSAEVRDFVSAGVVGIEALISGGDDYQLLLAIAPEDVVAFQAAVEEQRIPVTEIGRFHDKHDEVRVLDDNAQPIVLPKTGWTHF